MIQQAFKWVCSQFFSLDTEVRDEFADLPDKVMQVELVGLDCSFYVRPSRDGLAYSLDSDRAADAIVRGTPIALMKMSIMQRFGGTARTDDIEILGDAEFVHQINTLMKKFRIDWEEFLARAVGDRVAQPVSSWTRAATDSAKQSAQSMQANITEFIQEEIRILPPREEINDFMAEVDEMRNRVERLEAQIRLQENVE